MRRMRRSNSPFFLAVFHLLLIPFAYAYFVTFFPWADYRNKGFADLDVYISNFEGGLYEADPNSGSLSAFFSGELLWRLMIYALIEQVGDAASVFNAVTFFISFVFAHVAFRLSGSWVALAFLFNPILLDLELSQIRSGFGMSILYIAFFVRVKWLQWLLALSAIFVHSAMVVVLLIAGACRYISKQARDCGADFGVKLFAGFVFGLVVLMAAKGLILSSIGDRRADLQAPVAGMLFTILWLGVAIPAFLDLKKMVFNPYVLYGAANIALFFALSVLGAYGSRYVALAFPIVVAMLFGLPDRFRGATMVYFFAFQVVHMSIWL